MTVVIAWQDSVFPHPNYSIKQEWYCRCPGNPLTYIEGRSILDTLTRWCISLLLSKILVSRKIKK